MSTDRLIVRGYNALLNQMIMDSVNTLSRAPAVIERNARKILRRQPDTPHEDLVKFNAAVHNYRINLYTAIRFIDSSFFEEICSVLELETEKAYARLQRKYAGRCRAALELALRAEREYIEYLEKK